MSGLGRPLPVAACQGVIAPAKSLIGHDLPVGESVTSPDSGRSALGMFNVMGQHANRRWPQ
jgi:hypothetical protein